MQAGYHEGASSCHKSALLVKLGDTAEFYVEVSTWQRETTSPFPGHQWEIGTHAMMVYVLTVLLVLERIFQSMKKNIFCTKSQGTYP